MEPAMSDEKITELLKNDFAREEARLENDAFASRILSLLSARRRKRAVIISVAGALGAAFAGAQFVKMTGAFSGASVLFGAATGRMGEAGHAAAALAPQLLAAAALAVAVAATAHVLQGEA